jgi:hypothetical protein
VPSVRRPLIAGVALAAVTMLSGCVTTQTKNARTVLINQRTIDSETALRVTRTDPEISITAVGLVHSARGTAVAVRLRNAAGRAVSDLPISVGVIERDGHRRYLNRAANLAYYDTHIASIGAGASALWVLSTAQLTPRGAKPFAEVGFADLPASTHALALPQLRVLAGSGVTAGALRVSVANPSGIPQYGLPVYAVGTRDGRVIDAGSAVVGSLGGDSHTTLALHLLGATTGAQLQLSASATIFN